MLPWLVSDVVTGYAERVQVHEEEDRSGDEAVEPVDVLHEGRIVEEGGLDLGVEEDVQTLFDGDELQGMLTGNVDGVLLECDRVAELVDLEIVVSTRATNKPTAVKQKHNARPHVAQAKETGIQNEVGEGRSGHAECESRHRIKCALCPTKCT